MSIGVDSCVVKFSSQIVELEEKFKDSGVEDVQVDSFGANSQRGKRNFADRLSGCRCRCQGRSLVPFGMSLEKKNQLVIIRKNTLKLPLAL